MLDVPNILKRASDKMGLVRTKYVENKTPTSIDNIAIMPFFGDMRSTFILSSLLLRKYREETKGSKYFILATWPGYEGLFPYVDEFWAVKDEASLDKLNKGVNGFENDSSLYTIIRKEMNHWFYDVTDHTTFAPLYNKGFLQEYFERYKNIKRALPLVPSATSIGLDFGRQIASKGLKVFIYPAKYVQGWRHNHQVYIKTEKKFWLALVEQLLENNITPVVYKNQFTHDLSNDTQDCLFVWDDNLARILAVMRTTGCVLDMFSGISRLAIAARTPFVAMDERARYFGLKEYEVDDLCGEMVPKEYIFGFTTIIENDDKTAWRTNLFDNVIARLNKFLPELDRDKWPSTSESYEIVPYDRVRKFKTKKLGTKFIKIEHD